MRLCTRISLGAPVVLFLLGAGLPAHAQADANRQSYARLLNIDALLDSHARMLARRYNLTEEQDAYTQALLHAKANAFLDRHREELYDLIDRLVEVRGGAEMDQQELIAWGKRALPLYEEAKATILQGNNEWREILTDEQRTTHDADLQDMYTSFGTTEDQLQRIVTGQMTLDEFRRGPARQVPHNPPAARPAGPMAQPNIAGQPPAQGTKPTGASGSRPPTALSDPGGGAVARATPGASGTTAPRSTQPGRGRSAGAASAGGAKNGPEYESQWEAYVREFIQRYQLDEGQQQRAQSVLKNCQEMAQRILQKNKSELDQLDRKLLEIGQSNSPDKLKELSDLNTKRTRIFEPINEIFEKQLKPKLEKLPTRAQRQAAEQVGKGAAGKQPGGAKPGRPGAPARPQPQPPQPQPAPPPPQPAPEPQEQPAPDTPPAERGVGP